MTEGSLCVNVGCGSTPTAGWRNLDNSPTVLLARAPALAGLAMRAGALGKYQRSFVEAVQRSGIRWANGARHIPVPDGGARVVYSSHMIEHLDPAAARRFLDEVRRVLRPGGIARIVAPDLMRLARAYVDRGDADRFGAATLLAADPPVGLRGRLRLATLGPRGHAWMYDSVSLVALLRDRGFTDARALPPGITGIPDPGALDLHERADESIFVEGTRA